MATMRFNWKRLRNSLRRFVDRSGWTPGEISSALYHDLGYSIPPTGVIRLLDTQRPNPESSDGYAELARLLLLTSKNVPSYAQWHNRRREMERRTSCQSVSDQLRAAVEAEEARREAHRRYWLDREVRHCRRLVMPSTDPLAGLGAATIARLSGGTIIMRGARL